VAPRSSRAEVGRVTGCPSVNWEGKRCEREEHRSGNHVHHDRLDLSGVVADGQPHLIESFSAWTGDPPLDAEAVLRRHGEFLDEVSP